MAAAYPSTLPPPLLANKSRRLVPGFDVAQSYRGQSFVRPRGTATPVFWELSWVLTAAQAQLFWLWLETVIDRGSLPFEMPVGTEFGAVVHELQLMPGSLMDVTEAGPLFTYRATAMAKSLKVPQAKIDAAQSIIGSLALTYPPSLPPPLKAGKTRRTDAGFRIADADKGRAFVQPVGVDVPTSWEFTFRFGRADAQVFWLWFTVVLSGGAKPFDMPIGTEFGAVNHRCQFMPDGLLEASQDGEVFTYKATLAARRLVIPQAYIDSAASIIVGPDAYYAQALALDEAVTQNIPRV